MTEEKILNVKELAKYLHCSVSTIRNMVRNNEIPYFRVGVKISFRQSAIDRWIYARERKNVELL